MNRPPDDWALPALDDANRAWFTSGTLALQRCTNCGTVQHPPEEICHACGSMDFDTRVVAPTGMIYSFTIVHHPVHAALEASVPYAVVLVSLDELPHVRIIGNVIDVPPDELAIGLPVEAFWEERTTDDEEVIRLPQWRRRSEHEGVDEQDQP